ncbi:hypothetical protein N7474_008814 [Penicillium riverlandense]|uniref:uncharacterized protein n=1 Tax=Penicillium riverlandense TaxID=1903569 RepID=UPI0025467E2A|nr:uncharacterized protein N7474_008814 [Penicillium riverlandense]KAJ5812513.1 hypothetical protein N7474_008814 [Penicillium riverlandense]
MFFEEVLPSTTPRYEYEGIQGFLHILEQEQERYEREGSFNPYIIFAIDEHSFLECFVDSEEDLLTKSWETYDHSSHNILIKMETANHAVAAGAFDSIFSTWARRVRDNPLACTARTAVRGHTRTKRADSSWTPVFLPAGRSPKWPTLVLEVAWSERRPKLERDIDFWLRESNGDVKVVLSITVHPCGIISIEKWDLSPTSSGNGTAPRPTQKIEIVRKPTPNCPRVKGQIQLQFQDIFLRDKEGTDIDFIISHSDMEEIASQVWGFQFEQEG